MKKSLRKIWNVFTTILVVAAVALAVGLVGVRLIGLHVFTVLSGSMEPTYHVGSIIYVKPVEHTALQVGNAITFMMDESTVVTHRIVEIVPDAENSSVLRYRTKGDANDATDGSLVHFKNVIGVPVFTIPYLGYVVSYIQTPPGTYVVIAVGSMLLLLMFLPDLFSSKKKKPASVTTDEDGQKEAHKGL